MKQTPYNYQDQAHEHFLAGDDLLIQAPTGGGKTRAAAEPGLIGFSENVVDAYPQRIIYAVPMRVLARGFQKEYDTLAQGKRWEAEWHPHIQTGEMRDDPLFEGKLIFATIDQVLASFLNIPYGIPKRLDNINAGAMIGSYLIFDEFHLYPQNEMMLTVLAMLKMLKDVSRFTLMSATFSPVFLDKLGEILGAKVIRDEPGTPIKEGLFKDVTSAITQKRTFHAKDGKLESQAIMQAIEDHDAKRVLCVLNTVDRAQAVFADLRNHEDIDCHLLHSRFYQQDRQKIEQFILNEFENPSSGKPTVLIATQVVEVGLNISSDVLLTECAPAASIIQRAGRCARRKNEKGAVYIFQPYAERDGNEEVNYAPYLDDGKEDICHKTWNALCDEFDGQVMTFAEEQQLVEIAHGNADAAFVEGLERRIDERIGQITDCMKSRDTGYIGQLIRNNTNNTVPVYIDLDPNNNDHLTKHPWQREAINLSKGRISHAFKAMQAHNVDAPFYFQAGTEQPSEENEYGYTHSVYKWRCLSEPGDVFDKDNWRFVAHPDAVSYDEKIGLRLIPGDKRAKASPEIKKPPSERFAYHAEYYHEHITGLMWAYKRPITIMEQNYEGKDVLRSYASLRNETLYPLHQLCNRFNLNPEKAERLLRLTLALHDVGKLNRPWQEWARDWQAFREERNFRVEIGADSLYPFAHTDYDSRKEKEQELQKQFKHTPRGNHAVEGAEASVAILKEVIKPCSEEEYDFWMAVTLGAIMRHHTPTADKCNDFRLAPNADESFIKAMETCEIDGIDWLPLLNPQFKNQGEDVVCAAEDIDPQRNDYCAAFLYFVFVRTLRLADQRSGKYLFQYDEEVKRRSIYGKDHSVR